MSSASIPAPRSAPPANRHTLFWPMLVLLAGIGTLALYQVMFLEDQLDEVTRAVDKMDSKVKLALHEKAMFYALARDVLNMAPKSPAAEQIVVDFKIRQLKAAQPAPFEAAKSASSDNGLLAPSSTTVTNAAPTTPAEIPDVPPANSPGTSGK